MLTRSKFTLFVVFMLFVVTMSAAAQDARSFPHALTLHISAAPTEPPIIDDLGDDWTLFHVNPAGSVTGDLEGTYTQRITQETPCSTCDAAVNQLQPITAFFTIETDEGSIEGYYSGAFYSTEESFPDNYIRVHGQILSVTAAYADLYLADVYYDGIVDFEEVG